MEHEYIESVEHENHEAVEKAERERGEDMADEAKHEAGNELIDALEELKEKLLESISLSSEALGKVDRVITDYQKLVDNQE